eukprot:4357438-Pyramimonas_sp.AAC.1
MAIARAQLRSQGSDAGGEAARTCHPICFRRHAATSARHRPIATHNRLAAASPRYGSISFSPQRGPATRGEPDPTSRWPPA